MIEERSADTPHSTPRRSGAWNVVEEVPAEAQGGGYLSIEFTGYHTRQIRGERIAKQLLAGQVFETATR